MEFVNNESPVVSQVYRYPMLQRERANHDQTRADRDYTENRRRAEKAAKTRLKNRAKAGVCPCCNRTFKQLAAHMKTQHPNWNNTP